MKNYSWRTCCQIVLLGAVLGGAGCAARGQDVDPAKAEELAKRFKQGQDLEAAGNITEARAVFEKIIAEVPSARGSLREAGILALKAGDLPTADAHFEALHKLEPTYPAAYEFLIQINQSMGRDIKVLRLVKEFKTLHEQGSEQYPDFSNSLFFVRERTKSPAGNQLIITEFFDYTKDPNTVWMAEEVTPDAKLVHRLLLNYDPDGTEVLRAKSPSLANAQEFLLIEQVMDGDHLKSINVYLQMLSLPDYAKVKTAMLTILTQHPKPLVSKTVPN